MSCAGQQGGNICDWVESLCGEKRKRKKEILSGKVGNWSHTSSVAKRSGSVVGVQGTVGRLAVTIQLEQQFQGFLVNSHPIEKRTALVFYVCLFSYITVFLSRFICCISVYENVAPFFFLQHSCLQTRIFFLFFFFVRANWEAAVDGTRSASLCVVA